MGNRKRLFIVGAAVLAAGLMTWRLWPRSLSHVLGAEPHQVRSMACSASVSGVSEGEAVIDSHTLQDLSPEQADFQAVMEILDGTDYRPDFRNLLPWPVRRVEAEGSHQSASVVLAWGSGAAESAAITLQSDRQAVVSSVLILQGERQAEPSLDRVEEGLLIFHPTDRGTLNELTAYLQAHGDDS